MKLLKFLPAVLILIMITTTSCAHRDIVTSCVSGEPYGFWSGILHGLIAPFDLIAMLWRDDLTVFAQNNNGFWYAFGFIIGSGGWGFLGAKGSSRRHRN